MAEEKFISHTVRYTFPKALSILSKPVSDPDRSASQNATEGDWYGTDTFEEALQLAGTGDRKLSKAIEDLSLMTTAENETELDNVNQPNYALAGDYIDIGRYIDREPECMIEISPSCSNRVINAVIDVGATCNFTTKDMTRRLTAIATVIRSLEIAGYSVGITAVGRFRQGNEVFEVFVQLKTPGEYADWNVLSFWLAHASSFRRCFFRFAEETSHEMRSKFGFYNGYGYGYASYHRPACLEELDVFIPQISSEEKCMPMNSLMQHISKFFEGGGIKVSWPASEQ